jgi:hypothetical protein
LERVSGSHAIGGQAGGLAGGFIAYYRVSTGKQGRSGLGIEAQRQAVANYLNGGNWRI